MTLLKANWKRLTVTTVFYIVVTALVVIIINAHMLNLDTNRVLTNVTNVQQTLEKNPHATFPTALATLPADSHSTAARTINDGASYARALTDNSVTVTIPNIENGKLVSYLSLTDSRTSTTFTLFLIVFMAFLLWLSSVVSLLRRSSDFENFSQRIVAKVHNIERSPLTQSYLMAKNDDRITAALNHLGETIQRQEISDRTARENLYEFIEFFQIPIFVYDTKGAIHRANAAFQNEFSENAAGIDIFSPYVEFLTFLVDKMVQPDLQDKTFYFEPINAYYQVQFNPLVHIDNRFLVVMNDVTRFQLMAIAHNDFIANVSHEFKTPLTSIRGFADIIETQEISKKETKKFAKTIRKEADRLTALVSDTLLLTKQNVKVTKQKVDVREMITDILESFEPLIAEKSVQVIEQLTDCELRTDKTMLHAIFKNLIENAIHYTPEAGQVRISLLSENRKVTFRVTNTGSGLTEIQKERIFERFYRTDEAADSNKKGTGLGLAIVQKNIQTLGAELTLDSSPDAETTFTVVFK